MRNAVILSGVEPQHLFSENGPVRPRELSQSQTVTEGFHSSILNPHSSFR